MKIVQILIKSTPVNSEVLINLKNIENPDYHCLDISYSLITSQ